MCTLHENWLDSQQMNWYDWFIRIENISIYRMCFRFGAIQLLTQIAWWVHIRQCMCVCKSERNVCTELKCESSYWMDGIFRIILAVYSSWRKVHETCHRSNENGKKMTYCNNRLFNLHTYGIKWKGKKMSCLLKS